MLVELDDVESSLGLHTVHSTMRERIVEHIFVAELLRTLWLSGIMTAEVLRSEFDAGGYDLVLALGKTLRHVQLKSTMRGGKAANVKVSLNLSDKLSGCVIWFMLSPELTFDEYLWFGSEPGQPLPDIKAFSVAKHTKGNSLGVKLERPKHRVVPKGRFERVSTLDKLLEKLFGAGWRDLADSNVAHLGV